MARITSITAHPRQRGRYQVALEGSEQEFVVSATIIAELSLGVGRTLEPPARAALEREAAVLGAYDKGIALLAVRGRAGRELERRLVRAEHAPEAAAAAVERLTSDGFVDDARLARQVARSKFASGAAGRRRIEQELTQRGVARDVVREAVDETLAEDNVDERENALAVARRRAASLRGLAPDVQRRRLYGFLARRGYAGEDVSAAVRIALGEAEEDQSV